MKGIFFIIMASTVLVIGTFEFHDRTPDVTEEKAVKINDSYGVDLYRLAGKKIMNNQQHSTQAQLVTLIN
ncbi:MAG: hypothetical protein EKK37_00790 [Sphingobacteriales bacterium]|nr:MAG: hypothetical protein EKK37_00790 [Sphingobacteriales bacterium]